MLPPHLQGWDPDDIEREEYRHHLDPAVHATDTWFDRREAGIHPEDDPDDEDYFRLVPPYFDQYMN